MALKDYYLILGVPRGENEAGIRSVFRALARHYHPDHAGPEAAPRFGDIVEAYEVLSDRERPRRRNRELEPTRVPVRSSPLSERPMSVPHDFQTLSTSPEELSDRLSGNFTHLGVPKGDRLEAFTVEIRLTPEEAAWGLTVPFGIPVFRDCPICGGSGRDWLFPCLSCDEQGVIEEQKILRLQVPPGVTDGAAFELPLDGLGIHNFYLHVSVRLDPLA